MYRTDFWTLWEKERVGCFKRTASKHVYYLGWNRSPAQVGCMRQVLRPAALGRPRGSGWRGRWEGGSGWGTHVNPWLIHVNVWQKPLQYCKVISLQPIKKNKEKKRILSKKKKNALNFGFWSKRGSKKNSLFSANYISPCKSQVSLTILPAIWKSSYPWAYFRNFPSQISTSKALSRPTSAFLSFFSLSHYDHHHRRVFSLKPLSPPDVPSPCSNAQASAHCLVTLIPCPRPACWLWRGQLMAKSKKCVWGVYISCLLCP